ncbi:uncharacterized protein LOC110914496 [Helianthus annuus]|uniref:uncharacterized protein LOC110914496 n=1 Tax=Helianthus annuus TaxID=4232 RepID=UPI000B8FE742|nr:uncharacterized protein LOC110914496 [Helianthus annuus]
MDGRHKSGDTAASVMHDRGKPPNLPKDISDKSLNLDGADYLNESVVEEMSTPGTAPIRGIGLRVTNIEGNPLLPRRGMYSTTNTSILDGLMSISTPVDNLFAAGESTSMANKGDKAGKGIESMQGSGSNQNGGEKGANMMSYADSVLASKSRKINFRNLASPVMHEGCDVVLPRESVRAVQHKLANTLYGYFLGDRVAFPVVEYFVRNNWKKFGLQKTMMNANGFFFFQFSNETGMLDALKGGPWIIRSQSLFLCEWSSTVKLEKKEVKNVQVWVKIHDIPIAAYTEDGLSMIATTIGEPKLLDSYTTSMCMDMWGRSSYARALIEVSADNELREEITLAIPELEGEGVLNAVFLATRLKIVLKPLKNLPMLRSLLMLRGGGGQNDKGQVHENRYAKKYPVVDEDGYQGVPTRKVARKQGFQVNKQKQKFEYRPVTAKPNGEVKKDTYSRATDVRSSNPFDVLNEVEDVAGTSGTKPGVNNDESDEDEVIENDADMDGFLKEESHVDVGNLGKVCKSVFRSWEWTSNGGCCDKGTRIIIGWNPDVFDVMILSQSPQVMHLQLVFKLDKRMIFCSIIYAANYYVARRELWHNLSVHKAFVNDKPWCIMGDFNSALNIEDNSMGTSSISIGMRDFQECVDNIEVVDINRMGIHFTWTQKPKNGVGLLKKLDRVMGNTAFIADFPNSVAMFKPYRLSDHCPCILSFPDAGMLKPRSFKFANFLVFKPEFSDIVKDKWETSVNGVHQFRVVKKPRLLKNPLRSLLFKQGNLHKKVEKLRVELDSIQLLIDRDPTNAELRVSESSISSQLQEASLDEERFLKQKSKVDWLSAGDMNSTFFHSSLKVRNHVSRIEGIKDAAGNLFEGENVFQPFVQHYEKFFGSQGDISLTPAPDLFSKVLDPQVAIHMIRQVTAEEVKKAIFSIGIDKAPGPDGYTAAFFKSAWPIVGNLLRELNHTNIVLIPKIPTPSAVTDYRPIACCNVLYKCISKIVADRIKVALNDIVSINQSAFVPGRRISDNIMLTQELMHNYHRHSGPPRCAFKVDIQKAYDTVDWGFLKNALLGFGFHRKMVDWIMVCVSTVSFSICVNGTVHGFFKGKRGLRQGDPISPYLFTLVMEVLTSILHHAVRIDSSFRFHNKCEKQQIINLCFADDLFLFARGEVNSARCIMTSLAKFTKMSGLVPSNQKSTIFFCNVTNHVKDSILELMPFVEGKLPVRYLGVPLISSRLGYNDCRVLVERLEKRITHWRNKLLSFAGRLQLIVSVLSSMHIYWSSVFMLPARIINELEACMRNFLWSQESSYSKGKAKVSWKAVCTPKYEGGLGIRRIGDMNKALMSNHIWSIISKRESLWVEWVYSYRLKGKSFWVCKTPSNCCWSWRKLAQLRPLIRNHIWSEVGNGIKTSAWFDYWCDIGPLGNFISPRNISDADFMMDDTVANIYSNGSWSWPMAWRGLFPVLIQLDQLHLDPSKPDRLLWRDGTDKSEFSSSGVWHSIRHKDPEVNWCNIVWFSQCIPRHAFMMWLVMKGKLLTQDKILNWELSRRKNMNMMCCLLCYKNFDSHAHLFFECEFSSQVWLIIRNKAGMVTVRPIWADIVDWLLARARSKAAGFFVAKIMVAAALYFVCKKEMLDFSKIS